MAKKILLSKRAIQLPCGQAKPGQKLASLDTIDKKIKIMGSFCREFNEKTKEMEGWKIVNVKVKVFSDGTYKFNVKGRVTFDLIKGVVGEKKTISKEELKKIAEMKLPDLNTEDLEKAQKNIAGTARSAGIKIEG